MTDQTTTTDQKTAPDVSEEIKALREQNKALLNEKKAVAAKAKEFETRIAELEPLKERITKLGDLLGLDPQKVDPDKVRQEREVESRAKEARAAKIRDEVTFGLLESGRKVEKRVARMIVRDAIEDPGVTISDDGTVTGVPEYLEAMLATFGQAPDAPGKTDQGRVVRKPDAKPAESNGRFANLKTFDDLMDMGQAAVAECYASDPELYQRLKASRRPATAAPVRVPAATAR